MPPRDPQIPDEEHDVLLAELRAEQRRLLSDPSVSRKRGDKAYRELGKRLGWTENASPQVERLLREKNPTRIGVQVRKRIYEKFLQTDRASYLRSKGLAHLLDEQPASQVVVADRIERAIAIGRELKWTDRETADVSARVAAMHGKILDEEIVRLGPERTRSGGAPAMGGDVVRDDLDGGIATIPKVNPRKSRPGK